MASYNICTMATSASCWSFSMCSRTLKGWIDGGIDLLWKSPV